MNDTENTHRFTVIGEMKDILLKELEELDPGKKSGVRKLNEVKGVQKFLKKYKSEYIETEKRS